MTFRLAFPSGAKPGFNPSHIAASGCKLSVVPNGANFRNLLTGGRLTVTGSPTTTLRGHMGPALVGASGADCRLSVANVSESEQTFACVFLMNSIGAANQALFAGGGNQLISVYVSTAGLLRWYGATGDASSGITLVANVPYFIIVSTVPASSITHFLVLNLATGQVRTATSGTAVTVNASSTYVLLRDTFDQFLNGSMAVAAFSNKFIPKEIMLMWATDPWSFWYPPART